MGISRNSVTSCNPSVFVTTIMVIVSRNNFTYYIHDVLYHTPAITFFNFNSLEKQDLCMVEITRLPNDSSRPHLSNDIVFIRCEEHRSVHENRVWKMVTTGGNIVCKNLYSNVFRRSRGHAYYLLNSLTYCCIPAWYLCRPTQLPSCWWPNAPEQCQRRFHLVTAVFFLSEQKEHKICEEEVKKTKTETKKYVPSRKPMIIISTITAGLSDLIGLMCWKKKMMDDQHIHWFLRYCMQYARRDQWFGLRSKNKLPDICWLCTSSYNHSHKLVRCHPVAN